MDSVKTYSQAIAALRLALNYLDKARTATAKFDGIFERTAQGAALRLIGQRQSYIAKIVETLPDTDGAIDSKTKAQVDLTLKQAKETFALVDRLGSENGNLLTEFLTNLANILKAAVKPIAGAAFSLTWPLIILAVLIGGLYLLLIARKA